MPVLFLSKHYMSVCLTIVMTLLKRVFLYVNIRYICILMHYEPKANILPTLGKYSNLDQHYYYY